MNLRNILIAMHSHLSLRYLEVLHRVSYIGILHRITSNYCSVIHRNTALHFNYETNCTKTTLH